MKKKIAMLLCAALLTGVVAGCGASTKGESGASTSSAVTSAAQESGSEEGFSAGESGSDVAATALESTSSTSAASGDGTQAEAKDDTVVHVASLKGPTTMGLVSLMEKSAKKEAKGNYEFRMETMPDALMKGIVSKEIDIDLIPANAAAVWYNKTKGAVQVIDINTLGVLYVVSADDQIKTLSDLKGKSVVLPNKGATPDYVMQYLLKENKVSDVSLNYVSEATEALTDLSAGKYDAAVLPQPFATVATIKNQKLKTVLNLQEEWDKVAKDSKLVTGVTVVRTEFAKEHPEAVKTFMEEHKASAAFANENTDEAAALVVKQGIIEKEPIAKQALPKCNITYIDGKEMESLLSGYLKTLFDLNPKMVGGTMPDESFYYLAK